jgi:hypothetical protein
MPSKIYIKKMPDDIGVKEGDGSDAVQVGGTRERCSPKEFFKLEGGRSYGVRRTNRGKVDS